MRGVTGRPAAQLYCPGEILRNETCVQDRGPARPPAYAFWHNAQVSNLHSGVADVVSLALIVSHMGCVKTRAAARIEIEAVSAG